VPEEIPILQLVDVLKRSMAQALHEPSAIERGHPADANPGADASPNLEPARSAEILNNEQAETRWRTAYSEISRISQIESKEMALI
jgi:hypothetical protein